MRVWLRRTLTFILAGLVVLLGIVWIVVPAEVERRMNKTAAVASVSSERVRELHQQLLIADLHADSLLWDRDLLKRNSRGHVDVPRLIEGNVALQAFTVVTQVPRRQNIDRNDDQSDLITYLALVQRWPSSTWTSLLKRALYQAKKLHSISENSGGKLTLIRNVSELQVYLERRQRESNITAGFLGLEGAHPLEGEPSNIDMLFDVGFRMIAPTHFFDNDWGGSAHGVGKGALTEKGREMIRRMEAKGILLDLAHASPRTFRDALRIATKPVVVSHTGVRGTCDNQRNLSDDQLRAVARTGGVVGIGYWETAVCGGDARSVARAIRYAASVVGVQHVALGSDFDGAITAPFDTSALHQVTSALLAAGFSEQEIRLIMGENILRVLRATLPK